MLKIDLIHYNDKITEKRCKLIRCIPSYTNRIYIWDLQAFIDLLNLSRVMKSGIKDASAHFAKCGTSPGIFRDTMSISRFLFILSNLCFYNPLARQQGIDNDKKNLGGLLVPSITFKLWSSGHDSAVKSLTA